MTISPAHSNTTTIPRNDMTFGDVQPSKATWMTLACPCRYAATSASGLREHKSLLDVPADGLGRRDVYLGIEHLEHCLERRVVNDSERAVAGRDPGGGEVPELRLIVGGPGGIRGDRGLVGRWLRVADFDMVLQVAGRGVGPRPCDVFAWMPASGELK